MSMMMESERPIEGQQADEEMEVRHCQKANQLPKRYDLGGSFEPKPTERASFHEIRLEAQLCSFVKAIETWMSSILDQI